MSTPTWPFWPHEPGLEATGDHDEPPALEAVRALAAYTPRLASIAGALAGRQDETATVFVGLAAAAEDRGPGVVTVSPRGLRPRTPSPPGSLAVARSAGQELRS